MASEFVLVARASRDFGSSPRVSEKLFLTLAPDGELHSRAGGHRPDLLGEVVSVLDYLAVHCRDDIAGDNASLGRGAICLWLGDNRTPSSLQAETFCDVGSDRLNLERQSNRG